MFSFEDRVCQGKVVDVYDDDTVKIVFPLIDKKPDRLFKWNCRLINVDTPELRTKNLKEKEYGKKVRDALREKILNNLVEVHCKDFNNYCEECNKNCDTVLQNLILIGYKICNSCYTSKTIFPV